MISTEFIHALLLNHEDVTRVMRSVIRIEEILLCDLEPYFDNGEAQEIQTLLRERFRQYLISLVKEEWPHLDRGG